MENNNDMKNMELSLPLLSIIIPVFNAGKHGYLKECLQSVMAQQWVAMKRVELVLYDDASTDNSFQVALDFYPLLSAQLQSVLLLRGTEGPLGCGSARNRACERANGEIFVFQDADDIMLPDRLARSVAALQNDNGSFVADIVGGRFERIPRGSTPRYEEYHRRLRTEDLFTYAFRDAPLAMPTVACRAQVWRTIPFKEGDNLPEDLYFFYSALNKGFRLVKLDGDNLIRYRFHEGMTSLSLHRRTLLAVRVQAFEQLVLTRPLWRQGFSIWNSGRDGKEVYKMLSEKARNLLRNWGDVNPRKIGQILKGVQVVHFSKLRPPIACCVALDREGREFEENLKSLYLRPGEDYVHLV